MQLKEIKCILFIKGKLECLPFYRNRKMGVGITFSPFERVCQTLSFAPQKIK